MWIRHWLSVRGVVSHGWRFVSSGRWVNPTALRRPQKDSLRVDYWTGRQRPKCFQKSNLDLFPGPRSISVCREALERYREDISTIAYRGSPSEEIASRPRGCACGRKQPTAAPVRSCVGLAFALVCTYWQANPRIGSISERDVSCGLFVAIFHTMLWRPSHRVYALDSRWDVCELCLWGIRAITEWTR